MNRDDGSYTLNHGAGFLLEALNQGPLVQIRTGTPFRSLKKNQIAFRCIPVRNQHCLYYISFGAFVYNNNNNNKFLLRFCVVTWFVFQRLFVSPPAAPPPPGLAVCLHGTGPLHVSNFRPLYSFNPIVFDATVAHLAAVPGRE